MTIANRYFGIELEVNFGGNAFSMENVAHVISAAGVQAYATSTQHGVPHGWKVTYDGSVSRGCEVVSPKLRGEAGVAEAVKVANALRAAGCTVDASTGFHCHVDATDYSAGAMKSAAICYLWFETFFDHVMPEARRGDEGRYVQSNRSRFQGYGTDALNRGIAAIKGANDTHRDVIYAFTGCRCAERCHCAGRYRKLNLTAFNQYKTLEFRQHAGTVDGDEVANWIRLCVQFVEVAKNAKPRPRKVIKEWSAAEEMHLFFAMFKMPREVALYYMAKRKAIKAAEAIIARQRSEAEAAAEARRQEAMRVQEARRAELEPQATRLMAELARRMESETSQTVRNACSYYRRGIESALRSVSASEIQRIANECQRRRLVPIATLRALNLAA